MVAIRVRPIVLLSVAAVALACSTPPGGDARRVLPSDAALTVVIPSLEALRSRAVAFLAGVEGTSGVLELLAGRYGVDLERPEGLAAAGLDPETALVGYVRDGAVVVAAGATDEARFMALVEDRLHRGAGATVPPSEAVPRLAAGPAGPDGEPLWRAAFGVTQDRVAILALTATGGDAGAAWSAAAAGTGAYAGTEPAKRALATAGADALVYGSADAPGPTLPDGLGLVGSFLAPTLAELSRWSGGLSLSDDRLTLRLAVAEGGELTLPISWVSPEGPADRFAAVFPKTTAIFARGRFNVGRVRKIPSILRSRFLPATLPGAAGLPLPGTDDLLDVVEGDFAVGLLGLPAEGTLQDLSVLRRQGLGLASLAQVLRIAVAARVRDEAAALTLFDGIATQLQTSGWTVAPVAAGGFKGYSFHREAEAYSVLVGKGVLLLVTGRGEVEPFIAVGEQRALSLASAVEGEAVATAAAGLAPPANGAAPPPPAALGVVFGFSRLTRELADKGVPPYFLKIINDIRVLALTIDASERQLGLAVEVAL